MSVAPMPAWAAAPGRERGARNQRIEVADRRSACPLGPMPEKTLRPRRKRASSQLQHELKLVSACPVMASLTLLRARWKLPLIWRLREGPTPLAELRRTFPMASEKMLTQHLTELMHDGFVGREVKDTHLTVRYRLLPLGRSLLPVLEALRSWGAAEGAVVRAVANLKMASE